MKSAEVAEFVFDSHRFVKRLTDAGMDERVAEVLADEQVALLTGNLATRTALADTEAGLRTNLKGMETGLRKDLQDRDASLRKDLKAMETGLRKDLQDRDASLRKDLKAMETGLRKDLQDRGPEGHRCGRTESNRDPDSVGRGAPPRRSASGPDEVDVRGVDRSGGAHRRPRQTAPVARVRSDGALEGRR